MNVGKVLVTLVAILKKTLCSKLPGEMNFVCLADGRTTNNNSVAGIHFYQVPSPENISL